MHFDFATALVLAALVTGGVWMLDAALLAGRRTSRAKKGVEPQAPWYVEYSRSFFPVIVAVLILRSFIVEPFRIPSGSMMPTLRAGDFILVNKSSFGIRLPVINKKIYGEGAPERGDVAVFRYPEEPSVAYIKRIVGLPGDRIQYRDKKLYVNGEPANQLDIPDGDHEQQNLDARTEQLSGREHQILVSPYARGPRVDIVVPEGHYYVLGDNRDNSRDSRFWGFLPDENLIGKAFIIWMNWDCVVGNGHCNRIGDLIE